MERLRTRFFDLVVVGGGITGAGIVLEATSRGYQCALIEANDFAAGTSSRSSKMIHGGLRYLARREFGIVRESLREREALLALAPQLVTPMPFLLPLRTVMDRAKGLIALPLYERLAGRSALPRHRTVRGSELQRRVPHLAHVDTAVEYFDAVTDDARLTMTVLRTAAERGAVIANHIALEHLVHAAGETRAHVADASGDRFEIRCRLAVLAVGAWLSEIAPRQGWDGVRVRPAKGIHLVLRASAPLEAAVVVRHPNDGRYLFLIPWKGQILFGTSDTAAGPADLRGPRADPADVTYALACLKAWFPEWQPDIRAAWAGLRPLIDETVVGTADISREDRILEPAPGAVVIAGGKLTTFRAIARRALDIVDLRLGGRRKPSTYPMLEDPLASSLPGERLIPELPLTLHHLLRACREEMPLTLDDLLTQRLGLSFVAPDVAGREAARWSAVAAAALGWDEAERGRQVAAYRERLASFMPATAPSA